MGGGGGVEPLGETPLLQSRILVPKKFSLEQRGVSKHSLLSWLSDFACRASGDGRSGLLRFLCQQIPLPSLRASPAFRPQAQGGREREREIETEREREREDNEREKRERNREKLAGTRCWTTNRSGELYSLVKFVEHWRHGATVVRLTADQMVGSSNLSAVITCATTATICRPECRGSRMASGVRRREVTFGDVVEFCRHRGPRPRALQASRPASRPAKIDGCRNHVG